MTDLISRQDAIEAIMGEPTDAHYPSWYADRIKALPSAEPKTETVLCALADRACPFQGKEYAWCLTCPHISEEDRALVKKAIAESRTGEWILNPILPDIYRYKCSICKSHHRERYDFCPSCGSRMLREDSEEE